MYSAVWIKAWLTPNVPAEQKDRNYFLSQTLTGEKKEHRRLCESTHSQKKAANSYWFIVWLGEWPLKIASIGIFIMEQAWALGYALHT